MKQLLKFAPASLGLAGAACVLPAAPSTPLANEWYVPMEQSDSYALVDKTTGQIRFHSFDGSGNLSETGPINTGIGEITGVSSGFIYGGDEYVILASTIANRLALISAGDTSPEFFFPTIPGPEAVFPLNKAGNTNPPILIHSIYGSGGSGLELVNSPLQKPEIWDRIESIGGTLSSALPLRDPNSDARHAIGTVDTPAPNTSSNFSRWGSINGDFKSATFDANSTSRPRSSPLTAGSYPRVPRRLNHCSSFRHNFGGFTETRHHFPSHSPSAPHTLWRCPRSSRWSPHHRSRR